MSNNLVNILATSLATAFFYDIFGITGIFYATLLMTFLLVIFAEVLPKTYSIKKPTRTAILISPIIYYLNKIFDSKNLIVLYFDPWVEQQDIRFFMAVLSVRLKNGI